MARGSSEPLRLPGDVLVFYGSTVNQPARLQHWGLVPGRCEPISSRHRRWSQMNTRWGSSSYLGTSESHLPFSRFPRPTHCRRRAGISASSDAQAPFSLTRHLFVRPCPALGGEKRGDRESTLHVAAPSVVVSHQPSMAQTLQPISLQTGLIRGCPLDSITPST